MKKLMGEEAFHKYFESIYGERWPQIFSALKEQDKKIARKNLFFNESKIEDLEIPGLLEQEGRLGEIFNIEENFDQSHLQTLMLPFYRMDPASLFPARALEVKPGDVVLDMCAAPGGKTLVLIEDLVGRVASDWDLSGRLTANELSPKRRHRMMSVFKRYLPKEVRSRVDIIGQDGSRIGLHKKEVYDKILLDAPCSGERGVVAKQSEFETWKEKRTRSFGIRQYALLSSAFMALKRGGRIVYSTCSLSPYENDEVIAKLLKRKKEEVEVLEGPPCEKGEKTEYGQIFLPDREGWGPIYFSVIKKKA